MDRNTTQPSFVADIHPELRECPGVECCALRPSSPHPRANMRQVFQRNRPLCAFGLRNNPFRETVVDMFCKSALLSSQFPQPAATAERTELLKFISEPPMPVAHVLNSLTGIDFPIAVGGNVRHTHVNAKHVVNVVRIKFFHVARHQQIPGAAMDQQIAFPLARLQHPPLALATHEWDRLPPVKGPDRDRRIGKCKREDSIIVGNAGERSKAALGLPVQLVSITDFGKCPDHHLCRQAERRTNILIAQLLKRKLAKRARVPSNIADVITRSIGSFKCALEGTLLFGRWLQLKLCDQFHILNHTINRTYVQLWATAGRLSQG